MMSIACIGDSITIGKGDSLGMGWVGRLNAFFQQQKPHHYRVYNLGISGDRVADVYTRYHNEVFLRRPQLVLLAVGTNDCQRAGQDQPDELASGLQRIFHQWQRWTKYLKAGLHETIVLGVLPSDESRMPYIYPGEPNNWVLNSDLKNYNDGLREFCENHDIPFLDFWPHWSADMCRTHTTDGVHPNDLGYDWMFEIIRDFLISKSLI